ncbi:uncharacterized protein LOC141583307 [Saimiri boliviensis]|uniref:uncharacterized protein LOC141583307 n=1 Tax=Saimiri boliviensis TaxID=27679 RepID=UPI003D78A0BF
MLTAIYFLSLQEAAGLQQADQQEYPAAACPRREQLQRFLSLVTEESFSLGKWSFAELFPTVSLPGINSVEQLVAIYKGNSSLSVDELIDSIAGSHQQVGESSKPARRATMNLEENESGEFSLQDDEEEGDKCLCFSWPCSLSCFIGKTRKPRKSTRSCAQNILDIYSSNTRKSPVEMSASFRLDVDSDDLKSVTLKTFIIFA